VIWIQFLGRINATPNVIIFYFNQE